MIMELKGYGFDVRDVLYFKREAHKIIVVFKDLGNHSLEIGFSTEWVAKEAINKIFDDYCRFNTSVRNISLFKRIFGFSLF